ncbi:small VCP/p97-interacting protein isoform X2 [Papilio machaon]|uniref:small VCP/p97-interacting protein isoform X2 n=1 Tax=Papilio machaon TaxID=76193 RepID=UPI001E665C7A|nr:small VCP/p97-interacting protein isoform X2 [Papilio machaon]
MANINTILWKRMETRRRQQVEAAEKRRAEEAARGVKDPERVKRMQQRAEEMERREQELQKEGGATLKWTAD